MGEVGQEQGDADEGIPAGVKGGIDDAAVALSPDDGVGFRHGLDHIDLPHGTGGIPLAMGFGHIAQGPSGTEVAHHGTRRVGQYVIRHGNEGILLAEHGPVFADERQAVHVGIHRDAEVATVLHDGL